MTKEAVSTKESSLKSSLRTVYSNLEDFFLAPRTAEMLAIVRIATGAMLCYIHCIWILDLTSFFGANALLNLEVLDTLHSKSYKWTYLARTDSLAVALIHEVLAAIAGVLLAVGFATRWTSIAAWFLTLMTVHRLTPFLFGLDQITLMLALYLCLGRSASCWSVDAWLGARWRGAQLQEGTGSTRNEPSIDPSMGSAKRSARASVYADGSPTTPARLPVRASGIVRWMGWDDDGRACWCNTLATRLIQLHLCVIYFFGGLGKLRGGMWWDGTAMWFSAASYEYQSLDLTWIGYYPMLGAILTHITLFWEVTYFALVWPKQTRPFVLAIAVMVHAGIAIFLGMITFGWMMIVANLAFVEPAWLRRYLVSNGKPTDSV